MKRVLLDTSVYVGWFRAGRYEDLVAGRLGPPSLSAVVAMELLAGAETHESLGAWTAAFQRSRRLLIPSWQVWTLAARVLRTLRARGPEARSLTNDILIAMTARTEGLRLFTRNGRDFQRIAAVEPFELVVVS